MAEVKRVLALIMLCLAAVVLAFGQGKSGISPERQRLHQVAPFILVALIVLFVLVLAWFIRRRRGCEYDETGREGDVDVQLRPETVAVQWDAVPEPASLFVSPVAVREAVAPADAFCGAPLNPARADLFAEFMVSGKVAIPFYCMTRESGVHPYRCHAIMSPDPKFPHVRFLDYPELGVVTWENRFKVNPLREI